MLTRIINGVAIDIDETKGNELYFEQEILSEIGDGDFESILNMFWKKRQHYIPLSLTWEITEKCNFECPFCYIHTKNKSIKENVFSFSSVKKEIEDLISQGLLISYLTGGECLLHPDFLNIYEFLKSRGVMVVILTNASLLAEKHFDMFQKYKPYKVEVSIYGTKDTFSNNPESDCKKVLDNILKLKAMDINVVCKTPLNKCTEHQFLSIKKWCYENHIDFYYSNELYDTYSGESMQKFKLDFSKENEHTAYVPDGKKQRKKLFCCKASKYSFVMAPDLSLRPCLAFHKIKDAIIFKRGKSISESLACMRTYIESFNDKYLPYCNGCDSFEICQECIVTQYGHRNLEEYMLKKCAEIQKLGRINP